MICVDVIVIFPFLSWIIVFGKMGVQLWICNKCIRELDFGVISK